MKSWIIKQIIAFSEATGRPVPGVVRKWASDELIEKTLRKEKLITEALRKGPSDKERIPSALVEELDRSLSVRQARPVMTRQSGRQVIPLWAMSAAAALVLALALFMVFPRGDTPDSTDFRQPDSPPTTTSSSVPGLLTDGDIPRLAIRSIDQDIVLKPLVQEQERLAADMTNALNFMADNFLPKEYATQVNERLDSLKKELSGSI